MFFQILFSSVNGIFIVLSYLTVCTFDKKPLFAFLASSITRSIFVSVMLSVMTDNGQRLSVEPVSELGLCLFRISFGRPLPNDPFCFRFGLVWLSPCCVPYVFCVVSESLSDFVSWVSLGDFMNPSIPVLLFFCSCANSEIGLLICFLCNI